MTSECFWNSSDDVGLQDTYLLMSSDMNPVFKLADATVDKYTPAAAPRDSNTQANQCLAPCGEIKSDAGVVDSAGDRNLPGPSGVGGGAGGSSGGGGGGGDDNRDGGQPKDASFDEGSHEQQSGTSTSSGSASLLSQPIPPVAVVTDSDANGHHSEESSYSQATTAVASDNEGQPWPINATTNPLFVPSTKCHMQTVSDQSAWNTCVHGDRSVAESVDLSSVASTLSPATPGSSEKEKRSSSSLSTDALSQVDASKSDVSLSACDNFNSSVPSAIDDKLGDFQISQDMFDDHDSDAFTSTPSTTLGILSFSQEDGHIRTSFGEDSEVIIPPSPEGCREIPYLLPSTPSMPPPTGFPPFDAISNAATSSDSLKRPLPHCLGSDDENQPHKKFVADLSCDVSSSHFKPLAPPAGKPSERRSAVESICRYVERNMRVPETTTVRPAPGPVTISVERLQHEVELSPGRPRRNTPLLSSLPTTAVRHITFESATSQSSSTSSSSPSLQPDVSTTSVSGDVTSTTNVSSTSDEGDSLVTAGIRQPPPETSGDVLDTSTTTNDVSGGSDVICDSEHLSMEPPTTTLDSIFALNFGQPSVSVSPPPPQQPLAPTVLLESDADLETRLQRSVESIEQQLIRVSTSPAKEFRQLHTSSPSSGRLYRMRRKPGSPSSTGGARSPALLLSDSSLHEGRGRIARNTDVVEESEVESSATIGSGRVIEVIEVPDSQSEPMEVDSGAHSVMETEEEDDGLVLHLSPSQETQSQYFQIEESQPDVSTTKFDDGKVEVEPTATAAPLETEAPDVLSESTAAPPPVTAVKLRSPLNSENIPVDDVADALAAPLPSIRLLRPQFGGDEEPPKPSSDRQDRSSDAVANTIDPPTKQEAELPPTVEAGNAAATICNSKELNPLVGALLSSRKSPTPATGSHASAQDEVDLPICPVNRNKRPANWSQGDEVVDVDRPDVKCIKPDAVTDKESGAATVVEEEMVVATNAADNVPTPSPKPAEVPDGSPKVMISPVVEIVGEVAKTGTVEVPSIVTPTLLSATAGQSSVVRRTVIVKRIFIEEVLKNGVVVQKRTEEIQEDPVITICNSDGEFVQPGSPSPKGTTGSISKSSSSLSSLSKSFSSGSLCSGWLADVSSSKSSGSSTKVSPCPRLDSTIAGEMTTPASERELHTVRTENKSLGGGMKTLRSVRRRQCYEIRKSLNLSTVQSTPEDTPAPTNNNSCAVPPITIVIGSGGSGRSPTAKTPTTATKLKRKAGATRKRGTKEYDSSSDQSPSPKRASTSKKRPTPRPKKAVDITAVPSSSKTKQAAAKPSPSRKVEKVTTKPSTSTGPERPVPFSPDRYWDSTRPLQPGVRVMAQWRDGYYYPGSALEPDKDDRWKVLYDDDGVTRSIRIGNILVIDVLPIGQSILVQSPDGYYDSGIITKYYEDENGITGYVIEIDGGRQRNVPRAEVILTHDQAACMDTVPQASLYAYASISLENIVDGRRRSRMDSEETISPVVTRSPRTPRRKLLPTYKDDDDDKGMLEAEVGSGESSSSSKTGRTPKRKK